MTHTHYCDFCDEIKDDITYVNEIKMLMGYQYCEKCKNKNICNTYVNKWLIDNNSIHFKSLYEKLPENHTILKDNEYTIQRSDGRFDNGWYIDFYSLIKYVITDEGNEDLIISVYKSSLETRDLNKNISLIELFRINKIDNEILLIDIYKSIISDLKNI